jgi:hypothetical protein
MKMLMEECGVKRQDLAYGISLYYAKLAYLDRKLPHDIDGFFFIKPRIIEDNIGMCRMTQFRHRKKLKKLGFIKVKESDGGHNKPTGIKIIRSYH